MNEDLKEVLTSAIEDAIININVRAKHIEPSDFLEAAKALEVLYKLYMQINGRVDWKKKDTTAENSDVDWSKFTLDSNGCII